MSFTAEDVERVWEAGKRSTGYSQATQLPPEFFEDMDAVEMFINEVCRQEKERTTRHLTEVLEPLWLKEWEARRRLHE